MLQFSRTQSRFDSDSAQSRACKTKECFLWKALFFRSFGHRLCVCRILIAFFGLVAIGGTTESADSIKNSEIQLHAEMGLGGFWKVGYPTRTLVEISSGSAEIDGQLEIQTYDGDGVPVVYQSESWAVTIPPKSTARIEVLAKHGRANRPVTIRLVGRSGAVLYERALSADERGTTLPATQPWIVGIGSDKLDLSQSAMKSTRGALPEYSTVLLTRVEQMPVSPDCFGGVDLLVLSSRNELLNQEMSSVHAIAIRDWVAQGGRCLLTLGEKAESWLRTPELASLVPGEFKGISTDCDPGPLESYLKSQSRLDNLKRCLFTLNSGPVDLSSKTKSRVDFPLIARWAYGAGKVTFLAVELDGDQLLSWESRPTLLTYFYGEQWEKKDVRTDKRVYLGFDDIAGQLNSTLDSFPQLTLGNLASISILAGLFCLIVGPLDYFLVSRSWRKPGGTWITLVVCSLGSCMFVSGLAGRWKPEMPSFNSLELLEMDYQTQMLRGRGFAHFYGGNRGAFDFTAHRHAQSVNAKSLSETSKVQLDWFGQPGKGLGGFESTVATDRGMPMYRIKVDANDNTSEPRSIENRSLQSFGIQGVGIPAAGTKALCATWQETLSLPKETNTLTMVAGSVDLLEGSFENPLDVDLLDGLLIYGGRAYALETRIPVGGRLNFSAATVPKDITRRLQRRQNVGGEERSTPWDPADTGKLGRLMELISFHESAGSSRYTGLYNRYLSELDFSDVIRLDRAILICELKDSALTWSIRRNTIPIQAIEGQRKTFLRLIIPVSKNKNTTSASGTLNSTIGPQP